MWTFLLRAKKAVLLIIRREMKLTQNGKNEEVAGRIFERLFVDGPTSSVWYGDVSGSEHSEGHKGFKNWLGQQTRFTVWETAPSVAVRVVTESPSSPAESRTPFQEEEFARLVVLLATDDAIRGAAIRSGQGLRRDEI